MEYRKISLVFLILNCIICVNGLDNQDECNFGYYNETEQKCYKYSTTYKGACFVKEQCAWADDENLSENLICNERFECACNDGYRWFRGKCIKYVGFGEDCKEDIDCFDGYNLQSLSCIENKCYCSDGYYEREKGKDCRKKSTDLTCALPTDCPDGKTCTLRKCVDIIATQETDEYTENHSIKEKRNVKDDDVVCNENADCTGNNEKCFHGKCICKPGFFLYKDACIGELGVENTCKANKDCAAFQGAICDLTTGSCYCRDFYFTNDAMQSCIKSISIDQPFCSVNEACNAYGPNAFCSSSCKCRTNTTLNENNYCEIIGTLSGCVRDNDCKMPHSHCSDEECVCNDNYNYENGTCVSSGELGSICDYDSDCIIENSRCQDNICVCKEECFADNKRCYEYVHEINGTCEISAQCVVSFNTECKDEVCVCIENYAFYKGNECVPDAGEFGYCESAKECKVSNNDLLCRNSVCQCDLYQTLKDHQCSSAIRLINGILIHIFIGIIGIFRVFN